MNSTFAEEKLLPLIRCGLGMEKPDLHLSAAEIAELKSIGVDQWILPIIWEGMKKTGYSDEAESVMKDAQMKSLYQFVLQKNSFDTICDLFANNSIPYIPLKGSVIKDLYPEEWLRTSCDIDILVHEEDLDRAVCLLEQNTEFIGGERHFHDMSLKNGPVHLELHFSLKENMENIDSLLSQVWSYATNTEKRMHFSMTPEFLIFHNVAHMSYHIVNGGLGIRPFIDLWYLRNKTEFNAIQLEQMLGSCELTEFYKKCCDLAETWMKGKPYTEDSRLLEKYCLSGGVYDSGSMTVAMKISNKSKFGYLKGRLFANKTVMQDEFPALREKPYLLPYYHAKRWSRLLNKDFRGKITNEVDRVINIKMSDAAEMEEFIERVGLGKQRKQ